MKTMRAPAEAASLEFSSLDEREVMRFSELIQTRTGMAFGRRRRDALLSGIEHGVMNSKAENLDDYLLQLQETQTDEPIWEHLIHALTVRETWFFRNQTHIDALRLRIIPEMIRRNEKHQRLRIWSAGCATGEEPYTLAILLRELLPKITNWHITLLATDIHKQALHQAQKGSYRSWSLRQTPPIVQKRYFTENGDHYEINPEIREMVTFAHLNLAEETYPSLATNTNAMDLILCRNVAIYLPERVTQKIARRFFRSLMSGGWLIVGAAETNTTIFQAFSSVEAHGAFLYQKELERPVPIAARPPHFPSPVSEKPLGQKPPAPPDPKTTASIPSRFAGLKRISAADQPHPENLYQQGLIFLQERRFAQAEEVFQAILKQDRKFAPAYHELGRIYANRGDLEDAREMCECSLEHDPLSVMAHYTLALINQESGARDESIAVLKRLLYLAPDYILAHYSLASLYDEIGRRESAARHRRQAVRLASRLPADTVLPYPDGLRAVEVLAMLQERG